MPTLADERMELYAAARLRGRSMTQAAIDAGYPAKGAHNVGSRLNKRADVQRRMYEMQTIHIASPMVSPIAPAGKTTENSVPAGTVYTGDYLNPHDVESKQWRACELVDLYRLTRAAGVYNVSHACLRTLAQLKGDFEASTLPNKAALATLSGVAEIHAMLRQLMQEIPASERPALLLQAPELVDIVADSSDTPSQGV